MKHPQVINVNEDAVIVIDGLDVIDDTTQALMSDSETSIDVDLYLWDLMSNSGDSIIDTITMTYESDPDVWKIAVADITGAVTITDRHKYIIRVTTSSAETANMRDFKISEFAVDNDSFEATLMRLPYQVEIGSPSKIIWYEDTSWATPLYEAEAYQDGTGTTDATDVSRVTHRGPITPV